MAEVKQQSGSFSLPTKKKPPSFSNNGVTSSSFKHIYDDVFTSPLPTKLESSSFMEDDYAEIFGSSKSNNGTWNLSYSSIPILDLPKENGHGIVVSRRGESVDYGGVFGVGDGDGDGFGLPDGEELFDQLKKKPKISSPPFLSRSHEQKTETPISDTSSKSYDGKSPASGFFQVDNKKQSDPGNNKVTLSTTSGSRKAAHVRAYSLHEVNATKKTLPGQTPVIKDDMLDADFDLENKQGKHARHTSLDLGANKKNSNSDAGLQKVPGISGSKLVDKSQATCRPIITAANGLCQSFDNTKHSKDDIDKTSYTSGATDAAEIEPIHDSNHTLHELGPTQDPVQNDETRPDIDVNLAKEQIKHSRNTSLDLGANRQNIGCDPGFPKACGSNESTSADSSQKSCQASFVAGPSKVLKDDAKIPIGCAEVKKKGRHSRMNSLDLGDYKHSCELDDGLKRKPRLGGSYSFDASHDPCTARVKVQPSKMYPSSSLPRYFPVESHYKISENSSYKRPQKSLFGVDGGSPPSLAEELDVNSDAAVSAAALQRAIEEAEMRIRLAKAFLEREGQGSTNVRFKDTLKVKLSKKNGLASEIHEREQTEMRKCFPIDSEMQPCSPFERKSVLEKAQGPPISEDQKKLSMDVQLNLGEGAKASNFIGGDDKHERREWEAELIEGEGAKASSLIRGDDKHEGGEWEAAKHLNQLISGVKNRLASFMSWQTETEKKEDLNEMEANMIPQQKTEEFLHDLKNHEERTETNQGSTTSAESIRSFNVKQDKAGNEVDFISDTAGPSSENFQFFAFRNQSLCDLPVPEVEDKKGFQENREPEIENGQEQVVGEVRNEPKCEEASHEEPNDKCVTQDYKRQEDMYRTSDVGFSDGENEKIVEERCSLEGYNEMDLSHEDDRQGMVNKKGHICSMNGENVEMLEEQFHSMAEHDHQELTHEEVGQGGTSRKSDIGFINEEDDEIVEDPNSLAGQGGKGLTHDNDGQVDIYRKSNLGSGNEESAEIVKELCTLPGHGKSNLYHEEDSHRSASEEVREKSIDNSHDFENTTEKIDKDSGSEVLKEDINQYENIEILEEINLVEETPKNFRATEGVFGCEENDRDQRETNHIEEVSGRTCGLEEIKRVQSETDHMEETAEKVTLQESCSISAEEGCKQNGNVILNEAKEPCRFSESSSKVEEAVNSDEEIETMMDVANTSSEPESSIESPVSAQNVSELTGEWPPVSAQIACELIGEEPLLSSVSTESNMQLDGNEIKEGLCGTIGTLPQESLVSLDDEPEMSSGQKDADVKAMEFESHDNLENETDCWHETDNLENETDCWHETEENLHGEVNTASDHDAERSGAEAGHRRRRWFDKSIGTAGRPSILEGNHIEMEIDQEVLDESELAGSVEIHADKLESGAVETTAARDADTSSNQDGSRTNVETTPSRRKWFVKRGEEGVLKPLSLFEGIKVNLEVPLKSVDESVPANVSGNCLEKLNSQPGELLYAVKSGVEIDEEAGKQSVEAAPRRRRWFESGEKVGPGQQVRINEDVGLAVEIDQDSKAKVDGEKHEKLDSMSMPQEKDDVFNKLEPLKEHHSDLNRREKEKEKERVAVERAIREARERAFADARERARRDAAERPNMDARQRVAAGAQEKPGKVSSEATSSSDKASVEAKLKTERAAVERATAEARERALQKALSEKASHRSREQAGRFSSEKNSSLEPKHQSSRSSEFSSNSENFDGADVESAQRQKARLERQKRTMERATSALEDKNRRDLLAQKEQAAKNMLADSLDTEVKRWSTGKEGNLRALLSTLQYILGPDSGWQPVSLTDLVAATAVRKSYKKATLCVHPDKLQQRGATIQQKYICEKVFDLLKEAWSKFNPDER